MPIPSELYGPFGALVVLSVVLAALIRGDLVPGFIYRLERAAREKADAQAERNADSIATLAKVASDASDALRQSGAPHAKA